MKSITLAQLADMNYLLMISSMRTGEDKEIMFFANLSMVVAITRIIMVIMLTIMGTQITPVHLIAPIIVDHLISSL